MQFIQIIEFRTSQFDAMESLAKEWEAATEGRRTARKRILVRDRDAADRYLNIVFFDSYDEAMKNSNDPVTGEFAAKLMALADGEPTFRNLDVVETVEL